MYETQRTIAEINEKGYQRIALQFPDEMLGDAVRVYEILQDGMNGRTKLFILADTSYGSCCVDEVAAEHFDADVVVHYGRSCLSPTARLPVIYVFPVERMDVELCVRGFRHCFAEQGGKARKVVVMADVGYQKYVQEVVSRVRDEEGFECVWEAGLVHDPAALIPNRTVPLECLDDEGGGCGGGEGAKRLREEWVIFHIGEPMPSLLLVLSSRVSSLQIYNTVTATANSPTSTLPMLRRRYALVSHLRSAQIIGILVSTLSVKNYMGMINMLKKMIRKSGKKSYLVVVGKVNVEKLANFAEVEGWVGVGCWEQGVVGGALERGDGGRGFWRPVVTPWEVGVALGIGREEGDGGVEEEEDDETRTGKRRSKRWEWNGEWIVDFDTLLEMDTESDRSTTPKDPSTPSLELNGSNDNPPPPPPPPTSDPNKTNPLAHLPESAPPDFDLRTGRYTSTSRPLAHLPISRPAPCAGIPPSSGPTTEQRDSSGDGVLTKKSTQSHLHILPSIGGVVSPAAAYLNEKRSWRGLVVGYEEDEDGGGERGVGGGAVMEMGREGVARGYTVGGAAGGRR